METQYASDLEESSTGCQTVQLQEDLCIQGTRKLYLVIYLLACLLYLTLPDYLTTFILSPSCPHPTFILNSFPQLDWYSAHHIATQKIRFRDESHSSGPIGSTRISSAPLGTIGK